jgi:hypothetical protein
MQFAFDQKNFEDVEKKRQKWEVLLEMLQIEM